MPRPPSDRAPAALRPFTALVLALAPSALLLARCGIWPSFPDDLLHRDGGTMDAAHDGGMTADGGHFDGGGRDAADVPSDIAPTDSGVFRMCPAPTDSHFAIEMFVAPASTGVPRDLAFDGSGVLFAATADGLNVFDATGALARMAHVPDVANASAVRPWTASGQLLVATLGASMPPPAAAVSRVDSSSGMALGSVGSGYMAPGGIAVRGDGTVYVADTAGGTITRITPTGSASVATLAVLSPTGLALTPDGRHLYVGSSMGSGIYVLDLDAQGAVLGDPHLYVSTFLTGEGLAFDVCGYLYVSDRDRNRLVRVPPGGGTFDSIADVPTGGMFHPRGIAFGAGTGFSTSDLYIADDSGAIFRMHLGVDGVPLPHGG